MRGSICATTEGSISAKSGGQFARKTGGQFKKQAWGSSCAKRGGQYARNVHAEAISVAVNRHKPEFDLMAARLYLQLGEFEIAQNIIDGIVAAYDLNESLEFELINEAEALDIWVEMLETDNIELSISQIEQLDDLVSVSEPNSGGLALSILRLYGINNDDEPLAPMPEYIELRMAKKTQEDHGNMLVYPNPTQDFVVVKLNDISIKSGRIELTDDRGRIILSENWATNQIEFVLKFYGVSSGSYSLHLFEGEELIEQCNLIITK